MAYFAPYIDSAGLHIPTYADILADLIAQTKVIYGNDIYLGNDSMDYQYLSVFALKTNDTMQAIQLAYNARGPNTAIGSDLDGIVKINGLVRKAASYSMCQVVLNGTPNTVITNGIIGDINNNNWDLPAIVTLDSAGQATISATCEVIGPITALAGNISKIVTPTQGWLTVTNVVPAVAGRQAETDSQLRARQAISTQLPSQTLLGGVVAGIASITNVTRYNVYENDTNVVDLNGLPGNSITAVVEGGSDADIANQIYARKGIGCYTNGTTAVTINDAYGRNTTIRFYRPAYVPIFVIVNVHKMAGYATGMTAAIQAAINNYLNNLQIGESLVFSILNAVAMSIQPNLALPVFSITSITAGKTVTPTGTSDVALAFNEIAQGVLANVIVNVS